MNDRPIEEIAKLIFNMSERKKPEKSSFDYERNASARRKIEAMREDKELEECSRGLFFSDTSRTRTLNKKQREAIERVKVNYNFGSGKAM